MNYEQAKEKAISAGFGRTAVGILFAASFGPVNPYDFFGKSLRRSWSYAYFARLEKRGLIKLVPTPPKRRGFRWYELPEGNA